MTLIHLDRSGKLSEGDTLKLFDDYGVDTFINIAKIYPLGISEHGHKYGFGTEPRDALLLCNSKAFEWLFESLRLSCYPDALSRLQSVFALGESDVSRFIKEFGPITDEAACFEVESLRVEKRDMSLLTGDIASAFLNAHKYWKGLCSEKPFYEYLLLPPVKVMRKLSLESYQE